VKPIPTDEQNRLIAHKDGPSLALAVAGSGKTRTALLRVKRMLDDGVDPIDILLTTFSRLGAADMRCRADELGVSTQVKFRTIHSVAWGVIKQKKSNWVLPPEWWIREIVAEAAESWLKKRGGLGDEVDGVEVAAPIREILSAIGRAKANLILPKAWTTHDGQVFPGYIEWAKTVSGADASFNELVNHCYVALEKARHDPLGTDKGKHAPFNPRDIACSHDDAILEVGIGALKRDPWLMSVHGKYEHVIIDEAQDTTLAQWVFVRWLCKVNTAGSIKYQNLMVICDDFQAIYEWRGAKPELIRDFMEREGPWLRVYPLTMNFRSGKAIIDRANLLLGKAKKRLLYDTLRCGRPDIDGTTSLHYFAKAREESAWVANEIEESIKSGQSPSEIAVLYRINATSGSIEMELIRRKIPYRIAGRGFFSRPEIEAAVNYIALALDDTNRDAYGLCYRIPTRWIKKTVLKEFPTLRALRETPRGELAAKSKALYRLMKDMERLCERLATSGLVGALKCVFYEINILSHFTEKRSGEDETLTIKTAFTELLSCAQSAETPARFLEVASDMKEREAKDRLRVEDPDGDEADKKRVTLSTVHGGKGLEWSDVYVMGMRQGLFPFMGSPLEEERRLAYVAWTRAKKSLAITYAGVEGEPPAPSMFLSDAQLIRQVGIVDETMMESIL